MNASALKQRLILAMQNHLVTGVEGGVGIGKSMLYEEAAAEAGFEYFAQHAVTAAPTDNKGLPYGKDGKAYWLPYGDLRRMIEAKKPLFINYEDLGQASDMVKASIMPIFLDGRINDYKVSPFVSFGFTTNRREDRAGVSGMLEPLKNRACIYHLDPSLEDWRAWAITHGVDDMVISHAQFYGSKTGGMFDPPPPTNDMTNRPTPRSVVLMSKFYKLGITDVESLAGCVGLAYANDFVAYSAIKTRLPGADAIIANPKGASVPGDGDMALGYAIVTSLVLKGNVKTAKAIMTYLNRLPKELLLLGVKDLNRVFPGNRETAEFQRCAVENVELMVSTD